MNPSPKTLKAQQAQLNWSTRGQWAMFSSHRQQIERLLLQLRRPQHASICVLGAGNCNDLDLHWLTQLFNSVVLVDIDEESLQAGVARQKAASPRLRCLAPVDLTGIAGVFDAWSAAADITSQAIRDAAEAALRAPIDFAPGERFDLVLSPCVVSQLLSPARDALTGPYSRSQALLSALRRRHLRLMLELMSPHGAGLLLCDLVSSDTVPPLMRAPDDDLPSLMQTLLNNGKCFKGLSPSEIARDAADLGATNVRCTPPWLWRLGFHRTYLVYALQFGARAL